MRCQKIVLGMVLLFSSFAGAVMKPQFGKVYDLSGYLVSTKSGAKFIVNFRSNSEYVFIVENRSMVVSKFGAKTFVKPMKVKLKVVEDERLQATVHLISLESVPKSEGIVSYFDDFSMAHK